MISDPAPTCGVTSTGPIVQGQNVTLTCVMTYYHSTGAHILGSPSAKIAASIDWQSGAGTFLGSSSTSVANNTGERLEVEAWTVASGTEIPSYSCTARFEFTGVQRPYRTVAVNSVSWTCASEPVRTWCMYSIFVVIR